MRHKYSGNAIADMYLDAMELRDIQIEQMERHFELTAEPCPCCGKMTSIEQLERDGICIFCIHKGE